MVSLLVSASVCVSWYHSLVSMSVRPTQFDPDPVSPPFPTPLSLTVSVCQCVLSVQTPRFSGMLVESRLFFQVTVVCALRGASVNSYPGGINRTRTALRIYNPRHAAVHTLTGTNLLRLTRLTVDSVQHWHSLSFNHHSGCLRVKLGEYSKGVLDFWPNTE